jgi:hypothetical protein
MLKTVLEKICCKVDEPDVGMLLSTLPQCLNGVAWARCLSLVVYGGGLEHMSANFILEALITTNRRTAVQIRLSLSFLYIII